jgi:hypothetical protein
MSRPRLFLCSEVCVETDDPLRQGRHLVTLSTQGSEANVNVRLFDLARVFSQHLSPRLEDALEIATYVFAADCATSRAGKWSDDDTSEPWRRDFRFVVPVRDLPFWDQGDVKQLLSQALRFLSEDRYDFVFRMDERENVKQGYLEFGENEDWPFHGVDRVLMFSGGLDSLAGAVQTAAAPGGKLVLVSHRPVSTQSSRQTQLFNLLRETCPAPMIHIPVWVNKSGNLNMESTQRTRSFLYATLGALVAESVKGRGVRFFENGVVSLNLPVADEVLGARASRTTHPHVLDLFQKLFTRILGRDLAIDNPFLFHTKKEVLDVIAENGGSGLIRHTCSCAHQGIFQSGSRWHCGTCSQCIDRRIAVLAAGLEGHDPETDYESDVFTGPRSDGPKVNMGVDYARHAVELSRMSEQEMNAKFNTHLSRAVRPFPRQAEAAQMFIELHRRHGETVMTVLQQQVMRHSKRIVEGSLPPSSMLAMVVAARHRVPEWTRYAERIVEILKTGLPTTCKTHPPKDEPHLQELCDGILQGQEVDLVREFPFMRWGSGTTKPDWSAEELCLWVELKYVRKKGDIGQISEDIAADITKYGDNQRRVLYVVYDPQALITNRRAFAEPVVKREAMHMHFIP